MNLYASVRDENGDIKIIRDSGYKTKREFKETLSMNGFKIRFVCIDDEDVIDYEAEKYEYKLQKARENAKYKREWLKTNHTESSENAEPVAEVEPVENAEPVENPEPVAEVEKDFKIEFEIMYKSKSTRFDTRYSLQSTKVGTRLVNNIVKHGDIRLYGHIYENGVFDEDVYVDIKCTLVNEEEDYMITSDGLSYKCCITELQKALQEAIDNMKIKLTKDTELKRYIIEHGYKLYDVSFNDGVSQTVYCKAPSEEIARDYIITTKKLTCNVYLSLVKNTNEIKRGKPILIVPIDFVKSVAEVENAEPVKNPEPVAEVENTNKALLRIKINNLMCFTYLLTQAICKFLQNCNKVPNNTNGFIRYMKFNFLGIVFSIQAIDGKIIYVNFGRLSMLVNNRCNYKAYDYVLDCYIYFSNIYYNIGRCIINAYRHIHINSCRKVTTQHMLLKQFCGSYAENHS